MFLWQQSLSYEQGRRVDIYGKLGRLKLGGLIYGKFPGCIQHGLGLSLLASANVVSIFGGKGRGGCDGRSGKKAVNCLSYNPNSGHKRPSATTRPSAAAADD
ncbi:hypothetical protein Tco_1111800 [Tanacetum coccineum]|uniref:Uncharacterized protein n=1 Tax=Tanacetum coccineum TaxID=301880 RepID=A0ABQ5IMS5_9ASTR